MLCQKVFFAKDGKEAYELYELHSPDIVISDIKMPNMDGLKLVEKIRQNNYDIPIILLTSFSEQDMLLNAANFSIDGYILKPVEFHSLVATITKAMKRIQKKNGLITFSKNLFYNTDRQEIYQNGVPITLGVKEHELLKLLINNHSKTVTKEEISQSLWPYEANCESSIKNLVLRIRRKLGDDVIVSVRGIGYRLDLSSMSS
jgi:DNA-binding response OmpR family regulator